MAIAGPGSPERVVLVVGSCGLDRLLTVPNYPNPDDKIRTNSYHEVGGGNAANTASAMGRLKSASFLQGQNLKIRVLTKLGDDAVGQQLLEELEASSVDTTSPFLLRPSGSSTAFTTIIVSLDDHTRTCLHTPGSCGELKAEELHDLDAIFENVIHLHSDARHTEASLALAKEAKRRGIPVSVDAEKDRKTKDLDELMRLSDVLFTNSNCLGAYMARLHRELEEEQNREALEERQLNLANSTSLGKETVDKVTKSMIPSGFYTRWYGDSTEAKKHVVVTQGHMGALLFKPLGTTFDAIDPDPMEPKVQATTIVKGTSSHSLEIRHRLGDIIEGKGVVRNSSYQVETAGVLEDVTIVDSTGAGDAFIGGYLVASLLGNSDKKFALDFAAWVAGQKLQGPGARSSLPWGEQVDTVLGKDRGTIKRKLKSLLTSFNREKSLALPST